jgi:predicted  nucleic acid-binding Zn-ribbon protein
MSETTEIEKKSLEAHVELCAERYRFLEDKLETVEEKITGLSGVIREVHDMMHAMATKRNDQILAWVVGLVVSLFGIIGFLLATYVFK